MKKLLLLLCVLVFALLPASCAKTGNTGAAAIASTEEFRRFLALRKARPQISREETNDSFVYTLHNGVLRVSADAQLWQSPESWYIEDFRLGDINGDGGTDVLFSLWKSYSFGANHPARMENNDPAVRCHLFLYTVRAGMMKQLWCSSNLPRAVYSFELTFDGVQTPVASGAVLHTTEGQYTDDFLRTDAKEYAYAWQGWGFQEILSSCSSEV